MSKMPKKTPFDFTGIGNIKSVDDVKKWLEGFARDFEKWYRVLRQDVSVIQLDEDGFLYFGNKTSASTWRIGRDGLDWILEYQETIGTWTRVDTAKGS